MPRRGRGTEPDAVRELACPAGGGAARDEVDTDFAAAWNRAADPFAPPIPGIT